MKKTHFSGAPIKIVDIPLPRFSSAWTTFLHLISKLYNLAIHHFTPLRLPPSPALTNESNTNMNFFNMKADNDKNNNGKNNDQATSMIHGPRQPTDEEMNAVFSMCRQNQWNSVLNCIRNNARIAVTSMIMDNHISTTILHQAITSKGDTKARTRVIREVLSIAPDAATIKNGYGSLPLHVIAQRNTKMDAATKESLIRDLVTSYRGALVEPGGVGKRTPLHIIFTDYISPRITEMMIQNGQKACFMKDKKGYLPAHVACSRHCSPEKLQMLLNVNPDSLFSKTNDGQTLLSLAMSTATKSHPNFALIDDLRRRCISASAPAVAIPGQVQYSIGAGSGILSPAAKVEEIHSFTIPSLVTESLNRKRKITEDDDVANDDDDDEDPVTLLLHFSRHQEEKKIKLFAKV